MHRIIPIKNKRYHVYNLQIRRLTKLGLINFSLLIIDSVIIEALVRELPD